MILPGIIRSGACAIFIFLCSRIIGLIYESMVPGEIVDSIIMIEFSGHTSMIFVTASAT